MEFIDLKSQYQWLKANLDAGIQRVLDHGQYILGPEVAELEDKLCAYMGARRCITVANGTDAPQIAQMAPGIVPGDEVITPGLPYKAGVGSLILIGATSPLLFPRFFGEAWQRSGELVAWMTQWFIMQFISSPVATALHVADGQKTEFGLQILGLLLRFGTVLAAAYAMPQLIAEGFAISAFVFCLIYFLVIIRISGAGWRAFDGRFWRAIAVTLLWVMLATIIVLLMQGVS